MTRRLRIEWKPGHKVTGLLAMPKSPNPVGILLAHGAGAGQQSGFVTHMRRGLADAGFPVLTFDYPYTEAGRGRPDRSETLLACHAAAARRLRDYCEDIVLTGKSMGGRMGSHAADEGVEAKALVYYGYPLVALGKSEPRDTTHLGRLGVPQLFFCGTRDRLCPLDVLTDVVAGLALAEIAVIQDGDHSFKVPKRSSLDYGDVLDGLVAITADWLR